MPYDEDKNRFVAGAAVADLVAATGTANGTLTDVGSSFDQTTLNNNFKDLAAKVNELLAALRDAEILAQD